MTLLVDTSVWSLALRRDAPTSEPEVHRLKDALTGTDVVVTTGLVLQELLQGFSGPKSRARIMTRLASLPLLQRDRQDHVAAADRRNALCACGRRSPGSTENDLEPSIQALPERLRLSRPSRMTR